MRISDWSSDVCSSDLEEGAQHWVNRVPGALERREVLFAQAVHMDAVDAFHMLGQQLADREAEAAARGGGIIFGDLALAVHRIDAQPDVERRALRAQFVEQRTETRDLAGRIEDQMIRQRRDFGQIDRKSTRLNSST